MRGDSARERWGLLQDHTWCFTSPTGDEFELTEDAHLLITALEPSRESLETTRYRGSADIGLVPVVAVVTREGKYTRISPHDALRFVPDGPAGDAVARALLATAESARRANPIDLDPDLTVVTALGRNNPIKALAAFEKSTQLAVAAHVRHRLGLGENQQVDVAAALRLIEVGEYQRHAAKPAMTVSGFAHHRFGALGGRSLAACLRTGDLDRILAVKGGGAIDMPYLLGAELRGIDEHGMLRSMLPALATGVVSAKESELIGSPTLRELKAGLERNPSEVGRRLGWTCEKVAQLAAGVERVMAMLPPEQGVERSVG